mmetsp:Transcript_52582/g.151604  ORF Transcript_52582/g.151604 Transcript_52582/m.151604 type:complete len:303 (+) Transcript_52582:77-985(+)
MADGAAPVFESRVPCDPGLTALDVLAACEAAAEDAMFSVVDVSPGALVLKPDAWRAVLRTSAFFLSSAAEEARRLLQESALVPAGRPGGRPRPSAVAGRLPSGCVHVQVLPGDTVSGGLFVGVSSSDRRSAGEFAQAVSAQLLRLARPTPPEGHDVCDASLEDFLTLPTDAPPAEAESEKRQLQELLRRKSLADWYGVTGVPSGEDEDTDADDGLRYRAQSLTDWYNADHKSLSGHSSIKASETFAMSGMDSDVAVEQLVAEQTALGPVAQARPLHVMLAKLEELDAASVVPTTLGTGRRSK